MFRLNVGYCLISWALYFCSWSRIKSIVFWERIHFVTIRIYPDAIRTNVFWIRLNQIQNQNQNQCGVFACAKTQPTNQKNAFPHFAYDLIGSNFIYIIVVLVQSMTLFGNIEVFLFIHGGNHIISLNFRLCMERIQRTNCVLRTQTSWRSLHEAPHAPNRFKLAFPPTNWRTNTMPNHSNSPKKLVGFRRFKKTTPTTITMTHEIHQLST